MVTVGPRRRAHNRQLRRVTQSIFPGYPLPMRSLMRLSYVDDVAMLGTRDVADQQLVAHGHELNCQQ